MSANNTSPSSSQDNTGQPAPRMPRLGGRVIVESDDSSSDSDSNYGRDGREHTGGVKLNVSPYRPPQVRAAISQESVADKGKGKAIAGPSAAIDDNVVDTTSVETTTESDSDASSLIAAKLGKIAFQRGDPVDRDIFETAGSSSSDTQPQYPIEPASPGAIAAMIARATNRGTTPRNAQIHAEHDNAAVVVRQPNSAHHLVGEHDAQIVYPHTSCLFIANLPQQKSDDALKAEITKQFSRFGAMFIKIKRDQGNLPFGFIQYTNDNDAASAIQHGAGAIIFNRPCRVEMAKANRTFVVFRNDRGPIHVDEVTDIVAGHGEIARLEPLPQELAAAIRCPSAVFVEFTVFDFERDIVQRNRGNKVYRVSAFDPSKLFREPRDRSDEDYLRQYAQDRNSIYVARLPAHITEDHIRWLFQAAGEVVGVQLIKRYHTAYSSHAYVEFSRPDLPDKAIEEFNNKAHLDTLLKVERRRPRGERAPRRVDSSVLRQIHGTPGPDGLESGPQSGSRSAIPTPRRAVTAAPGSTPFRQINTPGIYVTPHNDQGGALAGPSSPPLVVSSQSVATPATTTAANTTPGAGLAAGSTLSALAPSFGPTGYYLQSPGFLSPGFGGGFGGGFVGNFNAGNINPAGYMPQQFPTSQYQGFWMNGLHYIQDTVSGTCYPFPPAAAAAAPPVIDQTLAFGQRSASAVPYVPAAEHLARTSNEALKKKKSVTFADQVGESSSANEKQSEKDDAA